MQLARWFLNRKDASHIPCDVLFDTGASKSYMSKSFYLRNKSLHHLPKFMSSIKNIQVGNGSFVSALFVIPIIICLNSHYFEIFTLVAEIQANIDLVFGMKNMYEVEGELSARHSEFRFLNRSASVFPVQDYLIPSNEKRTIKVHTIFPTSLTGIAVAKFFDGDQVLTVKLTLEKNHAAFEINNKSPKPIQFLKQNSIGVVDARSMGYYKVSHETLHHNLISEYDFMRLDELCASFNKMVDKVNENNAIIKEKQSCRK